MEKQKLNKKLSEWAGLKLAKEPCATGFYLFADEEGVCYEADFTQSLDACFKWLVPKAIDEIMAEQECSSDIAYAILFKKWLQELELIIPEAALALCLAISKLIEKDIDK